MKEVKIRKQKNRKQNYVKRIPKYRYERNVIKALEQRIAEFTPETGSDPGAISAPTEERAYAGCRLFEQLPISEKMKKGLEEAGYVEMTDIQRSTLPHGLVGRDILGAAKTGSGKTLAFLITMLEKLYRLQWTREDGLGALIISPVRELALQIFEELRKIGKYHDFSGGLLIGGKDVDVEKSRLSAMNILIGTPGRLLHHLDETHGFEVSNLQVLILDEADRLLDMGFAKMLDAIIQHLPTNRQSLLFSATQTKSVKDLVRLSLTDPEYLSVHAHSQTSTPSKLKQFYVHCPMEEKLTVLWSFIKTHSKSKILVFLSTCTQVRFLYEALKKLLSNQLIGCLHGRIKQNKRTETFFKFCQTASMVLLATDVAARGLDFPQVDWVLQVDCADSVSEYIHRVGRTARYTSDGQALLLLMPQEMQFLPKLEEKNVPIKEMKIKKSIVTCPTIALQALLTKSPQLKVRKLKICRLLRKSLAIKDCARKALITYLRSFMLRVGNSHKDLGVEAFAESMGLPSIPPSRSLKKILKKTAHFNTVTVAKSKQENADELFYPVLAQKQENLEQDTSARMKKTAGQSPSLLQNLAESWTKDDDHEMEDGVDAGVCQTTKERYERLKNTLKDRMTDDRAFFRKLRKEAQVHMKQEQDQERAQRPGPVLLNSPRCDTQNSEMEKDE